MSANEADATMPRFNHVAMSVPEELLDERSRSDILQFYGEVFGWTEMPTMTVEGERMVLRCHSNEQFVYLVHSKGEEPMRCPKDDHFGMSVSTPEALDDILDHREGVTPNEAQTILRNHSCCSRSSSSTLLN